MLLAAAATAAEIPYNEPFTLAVGAEAHLWIERPGEDRESFVLHTYYDHVQELDFGRWRVTLVEISPYPVDGEDPIDPEAYRATLVLSLLQVSQVPDVSAGWSALRDQYR